MHKWQPFFNVLVATCHKPVKYVGPGKSCRSTSVGDMIMLNNGKKFKCEHIGWSEV